MVTIVKAATLIDGTGRAPTPQPFIVIDDGKFVRIATGEDAAAPPDARVIDLPQATLIPGLIDSHEHLTLRYDEGLPHEQNKASDIEMVFRIAKSAREDIQAGITSVRVVNDKNHLDILAARFIEQEYVRGPRVYASGSGIRSTHGHGLASTVADGVEEMRRAVRACISKGAHHLKFYITGGVIPPATDGLTSYYTCGEIQAVIEEAHRVGRKITAHCNGGRGADDAIEARIDALEHGARLTKAQLSAMARAGIWLVPTLMVQYKEGIGGLPDSSALMEERIHSREISAQTVRQAIQLGVKIAAGTDACHGEIAAELDLLVQLGMSPMQALMAATYNGAELLDALDEIGTVEEGKRADLVAVRGDPLKDISVIGDVCLVMRGGSVFAGPTD